MMAATGATGMVVAPAQLADVQVLQQQQQQLNIGPEPAPRVPRGCSAPPDRIQEDVGCLFPDLDNEQLRQAQQQDPDLVAVETALQDEKIAWTLEGGRSLWNGDGDCRRSLGQLSHRPRNWQQGPGESHGLRGATWLERPRRRAPGLDRPHFKPVAAVLASAVTIGPLAEMLVPVATPATYLAHRPSDTSPSDTRRMASACLAEFLGATAELVAELDAGELSTEKIAPEPCGIDVDATWLRGDLLCRQLSGIEFAPVGGSDRAASIFA
ncbi:unnamed protein product [Lampetra planeri]